MAEKAWQLSQRINTKGKKLEQVWDSVLSLAKDNGWEKDKEEMTRFWTDGK